MSLFASFFYKFSFAKKCVRIFVFVLPLSKNISNFDCTCIWLVFWSMENSLTTIERMCRRPLWTVRANIWISTSQKTFRNTSTVYIKFTIWYLFYKFDINLQIWCGKASFAGDDENHKRLSWIKTSIMCIIHPCATWSAFLL